MRITLLAAGSQGDVLPCLRLGKRLQQSGLQVLLTAPQNFADRARVEGVPFHPIRADVQQIMASETGQRYMTSGGANPLQSILAMRKMLRPVALQMAEDTLAACRHAEALITLAVFAPLGATIAEIYGIRLILVEPTPVLPTGDFPAPGWPIQRNLGRWHNRASGFAMLEVIWQWYRPFVNEFRSRFGLRFWNSAQFHKVLTSAPLLGAYSSAVVPHPNDWPQSAQSTGYWFEDVPPDWRPSAELEAFLGRGDPPVYVGFGSMAGRDPQHVASIVLEALAVSGQRGILATGWGGMQALNPPATVFVLPDAPHSWLFPRMSAVVHHGGAGTTAEGLRAGVPAVIVPFIVDQRFWGTRVQALGAGPAPIPASSLNVNQLAAAIHQATTNAVMQRQAAAIGTAIRSEDGLGHAVQSIEQHLGASVC